MRWIALVTGVAIVVGTGAPAPGASLISVRVTRNGQTTMLLFPPGVSQTIAVTGVDDIVTRIQIYSVDASTGVYDGLGDIGRVMLSGTRTGQAYTEVLLGPQAEFPYDPDSQIQEPPSGHHWGGLSMPSAFYPYCGLGGRVSGSVMGDVDVGEVVNLRIDGDLAAPSGSCRTSSMRPTATRRTTTTGAF